MGGIGDEVALGLDRALERVERRVEGAAEPGELIVTLDVEPLVLETLGVGRDRLGLRREPRDRRERRPGDEQAEQRREGDAAGRDQAEQQELGVECLVDVGERQRDLERAAARQPGDELAQVMAGLPRRRRRGGRCPGRRGHAPRR